MSKLFNIIGTAILGCSAALITMAITDTNIPEFAIAQETVKQPQSLTQPTPTQTTSRKRHTITVTVSSPDDIQVAEGDRITAGSVIADRTREREKLTQERKQLELAIARATQPSPTPPPPPEPTYAGELAAIASAQEMIAYYQQLPEPEYRFKQEDFVTLLDQDTIQERQNLAQKRIEAQQQLNSAIANLQTAKSRYSQELYNYNISLTQGEADQRKREIEALKLRERLTELDKQIEELTAVRSPYAGRVRKVKITNQNNLNVTAEITLLVTTRETE